jgi:hypothetical protein
MSALDRFNNFLNIARRENLRGHDWVAVLIDAMRGEFDEVAA